MNQVVFCPIDSFFKSETGAVGREKPVHFRIALKANDIRRVFMRLYSYEGKQTVIPFFPEPFTPLLQGFCVFGADVAVSDCGTHYYDFCAECGERLFIGRKDCGAEFSDNPVRWVLNVTERIYPVPRWAENSVMYHIFVDRFCPSGEIPYREDAVVRRDWGNMPEYKPDARTGKILNNDFFGGNLRGIISKLDYLKELNVGIIYLSPIFKAYSNHKYDVGDYSEIDPFFGTKEDFVELCEKAKERGMRIILDGVFNHTGSDSRYFDKEGKYGDGAYLNGNSPYRDWYLFDRSGEKYECWWNFDTLPRLNPDSRTLREYLCGENGIVGNWLRLGASGWRLDVVDELREDVLKDVVKSAKNAKRDAIIIGEVWEDASTKASYGKKREYFDGAELDSVMNYPLRNAIIDFVRNGNENALRSVNFDIINNYPRDVRDCLMNILGTHDTERILTALGGNTAHLHSRESQMRYRMTFEELVNAKKLLKLAAVLLYTHYGFPCVYYGDEVGVQGCKDPFNRTCFPWNNMDGALRAFFVKLGDIRRDNTVFNGGDFTEYIVERGFYSYIRENEREKILVAVNRSGSQKKIEIAMAEELLSGRRIEDYIIVEKDQAVILKPINANNI